jgi:hypothetical protein
MNIQVQIQLGPSEYAADLPGNSEELAQRIFDVVEGDPTKDTVYVTINDSGSAGNVPSIPPPEVEPPPIVDPEPVPVTRNSSFSTQNTPSPGDKQTRTNTPASSDATAVYVDNETTEGTDVSAELLALVVGDTIEIRGVADSTRYAIFALTTLPIAQAGYVELPVSFVEEGGALTNGACILTFLGR